MNALTVSLHLSQPVLASQAHTGEANSNQSFNYLPGSLLRGALAACYSNGEAISLKDNPTFANLFLNGKVQYLNAYPINPEDGQRMLPRPLSWFVPKGTEVDLNEPVVDLALSAPDPKISYQSPAGAFFWQGSGSIKLFDPEMEITVHNASSDRNRKATGSSQVFRYDTLAAGQTFAAVILSEDHALLKTIQGLLKENDLILGGSQTGGYGRVEVLRRDRLYITNDWKGEAVVAETPANEEVVVLTCLSDIIYRSPQDGTPDFDLVSLAHQPPRACFRQVHLVGGFNRKWGLPLQQEWAISAGSVFVFPATCRPTLATYLKHGIGERLTEGFGRFALDLQIAPNWMRSEMSAPASNALPVPNTLSADSQSFAEAVARRRLERGLDIWLVERITRLAAGPGAFQHLPKTAQLARARLAARAAWQTGEFAHIEKHFADLSEMSRRGWKNATLRGEPLIDWILKRLQDRYAEQLVTQDISFAGVEAELTDALRNKTIARLIEGVLKLAIRAAKQ